MNVLDIPLTILRFQYKLVRIPLGLFEANVVNSLGTEAPARLVYERTVGTLDKKVGCMLGDDEAVQQGDAQIHHVNEIARAKKLEAEADAKEAEAKQRLEAKREAAENERKAAVDAAKESTQQASEDAEQRKQKAAKEAD